MKKIIPHLIAVALFAIIAIAFFYPVLQGKAIWQSDIVQYTGMAKERNDYRLSDNKESYWTNSAFGGMPTYQLGANYPYDFIKQVDRTLRFLPRPADYLFLYFIGFYLLLSVLKVDTRNAFLGAIAFGLSTYLIIILGVGHNAKAHSIAYFAPVLAGILLVFQRKYLVGGILTAFALALQLCANHFQMTYYLLLLVLLLGAGYLFQAIKQKQLKNFLKAMGVLIGAAFIAVLSNATLLLATREYAAWSTRSKSTLTTATTTIEASGLSKDYITEYSYGITESLNLIVPRLFGGSNHEALGEKSNTYQYLASQGYGGAEALNFANSLPTYWGDQPIVAAPAYIGIVVFFFFVLALFVVRNKLKWWLIAGTLMSLLLSWGKNFNLLTDFMIDYFPLYNKFRAVSSIQVLLELCVPVLAVLGLYQFIKMPAEERKKPLLNTIYVVLGILVLLLLGKGFFSFTSPNDARYAQYYGNELIAMIVKDRESIYTSDVLRALLLTVLTAAALALYHFKKLNLWAVQVIILALLFFDLGGVAKRYVNKDSFVEGHQLANPFQPTPADEYILRDKSYYRVYEPEVGLNGARTSFFHHSIGGYHAAKPRKLQELFDYQFKEGNMKVLNWLNVKYVIVRNEKNQVTPILNDEALGNAWFVNQVIRKANDDEVMSELRNFDPVTEVVVNNKEVKAVFPLQYSADSTATIQLKSYAPDALVYESDNAHDGFAVFSEMYYPHGWKATIDGKAADFYPVDYLLRGMPIPAGKHTIKFSFEPEVVTIGSYLSLAGSSLLLLWIVASLIQQFKRRRTTA